MEFCDGPEGFFYKRCHKVYYTVENLGYLLDVNHLHGVMC